MLFRLKTGRFEEGNSGGESRHRCDRTTAQVKAPIIGWNNMQIESLALYVYWDAQTHIVERLHFCGQTMRREPSMQITHFDL